MRNLLSWFDAGWSLDAAADVVQLHQRLRPDKAPTAEEAAAVRDEVNALVRGIMAECNLPAPVRRETRASEAPHPTIEGAMGMVGEENLNVSSDSTAVRRLASVTMFAGGMAVTYNDLTGLAERLAELAESPGPAGDMWWLDAAVVKVLERGEAAAEKARARWRKVNKANAATKCAWRFTQPLVEIPHELSQAPTTYLSRAMAVVLDVALERVRERERERATERGRHPFVKHNGDEYAGASKVAPAAAWALGAYSEREVVELNGQRYATMHRPRVAGVVQGKLPSRRVVQLGFPFETQTAALVSIAANDTQFALSPLAGKLLVWLLCTVPAKGHLGEPLEELARTMHSHTQFRREYTTAVAAALREIRGLLVVFDDLSDAPLFDMRLPGALGSAPDPGGIVEVEWAPAMMRATNPYRNGRGEVLINRSAIERMPLQHPLYLRAYTRAAGWWNDAIGMKRPLPAYTPAELAGEFNAMSAHAATDKGQGRKRRSDAGRAVKEALGWLEGEGLAKLEAVGKGGQQRLIVGPSEAHVEAYQTRANRGTRSDG